MIRFTCQHCGRRLRVGDGHAGKAGRCPHCRQVVYVPQAEKIPPPDASDGTPPRPVRDQALLELAQGAPTPDRKDRPGEVPADGAPDTAVSGATAGEDIGDESVGPPVRFTDALLYPANSDGLIQIATAALGIWAVGLLGALLSPYLPYYAGLLVLMLRIMIAGYVLFYVGHCVYDSSQGGRRAPSLSLINMPDKGDLLWQLLLLVAGVAMCFWPLGLYRAFAGPMDIWFWILAGGGAFLLPMTLLVGTLFDGIDALNPVLIIRSILVTFPAYLGLVVAFAVILTTVGAVKWVSLRISVPRVLSNAAYLYLLLIAGHLLGRFYRRQRDKLDWGL
jgi:hypothetical protein